jgi:hypothetical protein
MPQKWIHFFSSLEKASIYVVNSTIIMLEWNITWKKERSQMCNKLSLAKCKQSVKYETQNLCITVLNAKEARDFIRS